jgi:flagellar biosynthesis/type III secretory pathway chaperone
MQNEKLKELLFGLKRKFEELKKVAEEKQKAIVEFDYNKLEDVIKAESTIADEISEIEKVFSFNFGDGKLNLIVNSDPELEKLKGELRKEVNDVRRLNLDNRYLLSHSIAFVRKLMEIFQVDSENFGGINKVNKRV